MCLRQVSRIGEGHRLKDPCSCLDFFNGAVLRASAHMLMDGVCTYLPGLDCGASCFLSDCGCTRLKAAQQCETDGTISKREESKSSCLHRSCYWLMSESNESCEPEAEETCGCLLMLGMDSGLCTPAPERKRLRQDTSNAAPRWDNTVHLNIRTSTETFHDY